MKKYTSEYIRNLLKVYFIMGSINCTRNPAEVLRDAIAGGITLFQYREKEKGSLKGDKKFALAIELQNICKKNNIPFIVNDDIELALAINADGVHIGQEDEDASFVRQRIKDKMLGVSVHSYEQAKTAKKAGADYFGLGPIFPTLTKSDASPAQGLSFINELRFSGLGVPIVGIGGISTENARLVMEAGADGVSVITAISQAESAYQAARNLRKQLMY